jgi:electron transfer flavoprotein beta subunit
MLGVSFMAYVSGIEEINDGRVRVRRLIDEGHEVLESSLPAVITVTKEINVPRLPSLRGIMKSRSAKIPVWTVQDLELDPNRVGLAGSFTRVVRIFTPVRNHQAEMLEGDPETQVKSLIQKLRDNHLI